MSSDRRGLILDFDGTITDSEAEVADAFEYMLDDFADGLYLQRYEFRDLFETAEQEFIQHPELYNLNLQLTSSIIEVRKKVLEILFKDLLKKDSYYLLYLRALSEFHGHRDRVLERQGIDFDSTVHVIKDAQSFFDFLSSHIVLDVNHVFDFHGFTTRCIRRYLKHFPAKTIFKDGVVDLLEIANNIFEEVIFITNSPKSVVRSKLQSNIAVYKDAYLIPIIGSANKNGIYDDWHGKCRLSLGGLLCDDDRSQKETVVGSRILPGFKGGISIKQYRYYQHLLESGMLDKQLIVAGNCFAVDLALPEVLGAEIFDMDSRFTPQCERDYMNYYSNGGMICDLSELTQYIASL